MDNYPPAMKEPFRRSFTLRDDLSERTTRLPGPRWKKTLPSAESCCPPPEMRAGRCSANLLGLDLAKYPPHLLSGGENKSGAGRLLALRPRCLMNRPPCSIRMARRYSQAVAFAPEEDHCDQATHYPEGCTAGRVLLLIGGVCSGGPPAKIR